MKNRFAVAALSLVAFAGLANAATISGDTTGGPTWTRTLAGNPPTGLSGVGVNVNYQVVPFTVDTTGAYDFLMTGTNPAAWDTFLHIYVNSFDSSAQLTNVVAASDDFPSIGLSGFTGLNLTAGTQYFAVANGFDSSDFGQYDLSISGVGAVTFVPAPSAAGFLALAGLAGTRRRR